MKTTNTLRGRCLNVRRSERAATVDVGGKDCEGDSASCRGVNVRSVFVGEDKMDRAVSPQGSSSVCSCPTEKKSKRRRRRRRRRNGRRNGRLSNRLGEEGSRWLTQSGVVLVEKVASASSWGFKVVMCGVEFWRRQGPPPPLVEASQPTLPAQAGSYLRYLYLVPLGGSSWSPGSRRLPSWSRMGRGERCLSQAKVPLSWVNPPREMNNN